MTMSEDVFGNAESTTTEEAPVVKTPEDRLRDKDEFIAQLKKETAELREDLQKRVDAEAQLNELRKEIQSIRAERNTVQSRENTTPALSEVDIRSLVRQTMTETESMKTAEQNIREANDALVAEYGGDLQKAGAAIQAKAKELGLSIEFLKDVAAKSPTAFLNVVGAAKVSGEGSPSLIQTTVNTNALANVNTSTAKVGTKAYFDQIRKTDPKRYYTPETQLQIMKAAKTGTY